MIASIEAYLASQQVAPVIFGTIVFLLALGRFQQQPPPARPVSDRSFSVGWMLETARNLTRSGRRGLVQYLPPPRANTTAFSFWLYRLIYSCSAVFVFILIYKVPGLREGINEVIGWLNLKEGAGFTELGPLALAFIIAGLVPPPFRGSEESVRRFFYARASIDARLTTEIARLDDDLAYMGDDLFENGKCLAGGAVERVRQELTADGFDPDDLRYDPANPDARSMWMKASLLMTHIKVWQADRRYGKAFAELKQADGVTRTFKVVESNYGLLKDKARACFESLRERPDLPEPELCQGFRQDCRELLKSIYSLLARVSLATHLTDHDRIVAMAEIGFKLRPSENGPMPDIEDLAALAILIFVVVYAPIALIHGAILRPIVICAMVFATILVPITIAHAFPNFALRRGHFGPGLAFPLGSGIAVAVIQFSLSTLFMQEGSLEERLTAYADGSWPWTAYSFAIGTIIACRMRAGHYPTPSQLEQRKWRAWGDLQDGLWLAGTAALVVTAAFLPAALDAPPDRSIGQTWGRIIIPPIAAFAMGFFVPTWYRAKAREKR